MHALRAARRGGRAHARQGALRNPGGYGDAPALAGGGLPRRPVSMSTGNLAELYEAAQAGRGGGGAGAGLAGLRGVASSSNLWDQQAGARAGAGAGLGCNTAVVKLFGLSGRAAASPCADQGGVGGSCGVIALCSNPCRGPQQARGRRSAPAQRGGGERGRQLKCLLERQMRTM